MLLLAKGSRLTGQKLQNEVGLPEGRVTLVDAYLAGAGAWADPLASLVIIYYGVREAIHALDESARPLAF